MDFLTDFTEGVQDFRVVGDPLIYDDSFTLIPLLLLIFMLWCAYITGGQCNLSTIQPTMANLRVN